MGKPGNENNRSEARDPEAELYLLRRREALLDATEQVARIGHCEWNYDEECIVSCSEGYARIFHMSVDEILEVHPRRESLFELVHADDRESCIRSWRSMRDVGSHEIEYRVILKNGQTRYLHETGVLVPGDDGDNGEAVALLQDITERRVYQQDLENRDALAQQVEAITDIGHYIFNLSSQTYIYISQGFARIHGVSVDEYKSMVSTRADDIEDVHREDYERLAEVYQRHAELGEDINVEYRIFRSDGEIRWIREQGTALLSPAGEAVKSTGVIQDITEQTNTEHNLREARDSLEEMVRRRTRKLAATVRQLEDEIRERKKIAEELDFLANHDTLTGLPSLRLCKDRLEHSLAEARRNRQMSAVMFLDLDGFKEVNDEHGHEFGDLVLKTTADRIIDEIRETDTVARIGGDEFVIILSSLPEVAIAERIAGSLVERISQPIHIEKERVTVSASIGISLYPENGATAEALIRTADRVMYLVKRQGKNSFGIATSRETQTA